MKIGTELIGFEISLKNWVFGFTWWYPVLTKNVAARDQARVDLVGFSRDSYDRGPFKISREVRPLHKNSKIT